MDYQIQAERAKNSLLHKLPVKPCVRDAGGIVAAYSADVRAITTSRQLKEHVRKWQAIWGLPVQLDLELTYEERALTRLRIKWRDVVKFVVSRGEPARPNNEAWKIAMHILAPHALVKAIIGAKHFGVATDVAIIQLYDGQDFF